MLRLTGVLTFALALVVAPSRVWAQNGQQQPLSALLPELYRTVTILESRNFAVYLQQYQSFFPDGAEQIAAAALDRQQLSWSVIDLASNQLSSFPLGSASGGFSWIFDTASATFTRASNSFGPIFAERPLTIGRRRFNVGANYQRVTFDRLEGRSLRGEVVGYLGAGNPSLGVFYEDALDLKVTSDTVNIFATYGLTDRLDIGVAVPFNRIEMDAKLSTRIGSTWDGVDDRVVLVTPASGSASGVGDLVVRLKANLLKDHRWGIAETVDVRLPTGDELELLGLAGAQVKFTLITSSTYGAVSPHLNLAYTASGSSGAADDEDSYVIAPPHEINYAAGADVAVSSRATIAGGVVGRILREAGLVKWGPGQFGADYPQFHYQSGEDLQLLLGTAGLKVNAFGNILLTTNVLFPLTTRGLTDNLTWMAGFDYSF